jgi:hypothetical protein
MIDIRPLRPEDDRDAFSSGDADLDGFFKKFAGQNQFRLHVGTTYVAVDDQVIVGFLTLAAASFLIEGLPKRHRRRLPRYPLPALRIARWRFSSNLRDSEGIQLAR